MSCGGPMVAGNGSDLVASEQQLSGAVLAADEVAASAGTIAYELLCAVASRVPFSPPP